MSYGYSTCGQKSVLHRKIVSSLARVESPYYDFVSEFDLDGGREHIKFRFDGDVLRQYRFQSLYQGAKGRFVGTAQCFTDGAKIYSEPDRKHVSISGPYMSCDIRDERFQTMDDCISYWDSETARIGENPQNRTFSMRKQFLKGVKVYPVTSFTSLELKEEEEDKNRQTDLMRIAHELRMEAFASLHDSAGNLQTTLEVLSTLYGLAKGNFLKATEAVKSVSVRKARKALKKQSRRLAEKLSTVKGVSQEAGNLWLKYRYAYLTTKSDIEENIAFFCRGTDTGSFQTLRSGTEVDGVKVSFLANIRKAEHDLRRGLNEAYERGFAFDAFTVWDLTPFSFVLDWVLPVGDFLEEYSEYQWAKTAYTVRYAITSYKSKTNYTLPGYVGSCSITRYSRSVSDKIPTWEFEWDGSSSNRTTLKRVADSIALLNG